MEDGICQRCKELKIVEDFREFCSFIETEKPLLSQKKGVLGKKDAYEINSRLHYKREVDAPNYQHEHYFCLDLLFSLALDGQLFVKAKDEKDKYRLQNTKLLASFKLLNNHEQYAFLLETYWCYYNFKSKFNSFIWGIELYPLQDLIRTFLNTGAGYKIIKENQPADCSLRGFFSFDSQVVFQLSYFAICSYELNEEATKSYDDKLKAIIPTPLGVTLSGLLLQQGLQYRQNNLPPAYRTVAAKKSKEKAKKGLHKVLAKAFPEGVVTKTVDPWLDHDQEGTYYFKIALRKNLWRIIKLAHNHTFKDLHLAIQEAFELNDDHLYVFFLDKEEKSRWMEYGVYCSEANDGDFYAEEILIGKCGLYPGQIIAYLFDFGSSIVFDITVIRIDTREPLPYRPILVEQKGDSPDFYPEWD